MKISLHQWWILYREIFDFRERKLFNIRSAPECKSRTVNVYGLHVTFHISIAISQTAISCDCLHINQSQDERLTGQLNLNLRCAVHYLNGQDVGFLLNLTPLPRPHNWLGVTFTWRKMSSFIINAIKQHIVSMGYVCEFRPTSRANGKEVYSQCIWIQAQS